MTSETSMPGTEPFRPVKLSLADLIGPDIVAAAARAGALLSGADEAELRSRGETKVDFFPRAFRGRLVSLLPKVGTRVAPPLGRSRAGAASTSFSLAAHSDQAPLAGMGYFRVGEDGRLYFCSKSEHYHAPLGHGFPGYKLVEIARQIGIGNATHNNTRGTITRLLETELVRTANGLDHEDTSGLARALRSQSPRVLNRVLNLETGSLAAEAAIKMMLAQFFLVQPGMSRAANRGKTPVFLVIGDEDGDARANYHGTTMIAQLMRGMWPEMRAKIEAHDILKVVPVPQNNVQALEWAFRKYHKGRYRIAGFVHEIVLMNYGATGLTRTFLKRAYTLCRRHNVPALADEIQSCVWSPDLFMVREYGLKPSFLAVGKGFPGGEYAASRLLFSTKYDVLPQFGALVTNGQQELASLAYLITMRWVEANREAIRIVGDYYHGKLREIARRYPRVMDRVEGCRHMSSLYFHEMDLAKMFVNALTAGGLDLSVQNYKTDCPPSVLTKLPLIAGGGAVDMVLGKMEEALEGYMA